MTASGLPDAYAPDAGPDAGEVLIDGDTYAPDAVRTYARHLIELADFAELQARKGHPCQACGADIGEPCRPSCIGEAAHLDETTDDGCEECNGLDKHYEGCPYLTGDWS